MLIFKNGTLRWTEVAADAPLVDEDGNAVAAPEAEQHECECWIATLREDKKGRYPDGPFKNCEYSVTINQEDVTPGFNPTAISLTHIHKGDLGERQVQRIEYYDLTGSIELWV